MRSPNDYSLDWFDIFLDTYPEAYTQAEIEFLAAYLPQPNYSTVLDICCGRGRHAFLLAKRGYQVTGVDLNETVITQAQRQSSGNPQFLVHDMRALDDLAGTYDAALNMWQSFGYFDETTNTAVLKSINSKIKLGGRFIIDIYNRDFFADKFGENKFERAGKSITERKILKDNRLRVELDYGEAQNSDVFSWQVFTPAEFEALAEECGFDTVIMCTNVNVNLSPSAQYPRMQFVLEKQDTP